MSGRLGEISIWLSNLPNRDVQVLIVHDIQDQHTSSEIHFLVSSCKDDRIKLFEGKFGSPGSARNFGLSNSRSKWVIFVDSDDIVDLSEVFSLIDQHNGQSNVLIGEYEICDRTTGAVLKKECHPDPKMDIAINPGIWRMVFLRETISKVKFSISLMGEDQLFLLELGIFGQEIQFFDNIVYRYFRNSSGQLTSNKDAIKHLKSIIPNTLVHLKSAEKPQRAYVSMMLFRQIATKNKNLDDKNYQSLLVSIFSDNRILGPKHYLYLCRAAFQLAKHKRSNAAVKTIFLPLTGGLGNQLFQYAAALSRNGRQIVLDYKLGLPRVGQGANPVLEDYELNKIVHRYESGSFKKLFSKTNGYLLRSGMIPTRIEKKWPIRKITHFLGRLVLGLYFKNKFKLIQATDNGFFETGLTCQNELLIGYFQSHMWADLPSVESELRKLRLKSYSENLRRFLDNYADQKILCVHVRRGDYRNEQNFGLLPPTYYERAINEVSRLLEFDRIWLFSDEPNFALTLIPERFKVKTDVVPDFNGSASETLELMRHAEAYVIANSSLSWWGAWLSYSENPVVIAPNPWFRGAPEPNQLIPSKWQRISAWDHDDD